MYNGHIGEQFIFWLTIMLIQSVNYAKRDERGWDTARYENFMNDWTASLTFFGWYFFLGTWAMAAMDY